MLPVAECYGALHSILCRPAGLRRGLTVVCAQAAEDMGVTVTQLAAFRLMGAWAGS